MLHVTDGRKRQQKNFLSIFFLFFTHVNESILQQLSSTSQYFIRFSFFAQIILFRIPTHSPCSGTNPERASKLTRGWSAFIAIRVTGGPYLALFTRVAIGGKKTSAEACNCAALAHARHSSHSTELMNGEFIICISCKTMWLFCPSAFVGGQLSACLFAERADYAFLAVQVIVTRMDQDL